MLRGITWLGKTVAVGLIISFLSIWTTGYIVNSYVESLLKQYNIPLEMKPAAVSGVWGKLWGVDGGKDPGDSKDGAVSRNSSGSGGSVTGDNSTGSSSAGSSGKATPVMNEDGETQDGQQGLAPLTGVGAGGGSQAAGSNGGTISEGGLEGSAGDQNGVDGQEVAVTTDDITGLKEEMSGEDKDKLFTLLMAKLPQESWQMLSELMENGLTDQELTTVQQIMAQHLDKEEYDSMMTILKKY